MWLEGGSNARSLQAQPFWTFDSLGVRKRRCHVLTLKFLQQTLIPALQPLWYGQFHTRHLSSSQRSVCISSTTQATTPNLNKKRIYSQKIRRARARFTSGLHVVTTSTQLNDFTGTIHPTTQKRTYSKRAVQPSDD